MLKSKSGLIRFIANAVLFLLIVFVSDRIVGKVLRHYYFSSASGVNYKTTYSLDSTTAEIIILGSSRAQHHYIPAIFEDSLQMSCYNTGRDGNFLLYNYGVFTSIIKRYTPKIIILDINAVEVYFNPLDYEGLSSLAPYYENSPELKYIIELKSKSEKFKHYSEIYPFNSTVLSVISENISNPIPEDVKMRGYLPLYGKMKNKNIVNRKSEGGNLDQEKLNSLDSIANMCNNYGIRLYLVQSPRYLIIEQTESSKILRRIALAYNFQYWDYSFDSTFINNAQLFKDETHLNNDGAVYFTNMISKKIKQDMVLQSRLN